MENAEFDRSSRFAHLLQPIKDLEDNWKIDIAAELHNYLEELDAITISVEGEGGIRKTVDFAEAALLIQGATSVYGKKVEFLYQLVQTVLGLLNNRKQQKDNPKKRGNAAHDQHHEDADEEGFDSLDDPQQSDAVDLRDENAEINGRKHHQPPMPMALVPLDDHEKRDIPLCNKRLEVIGKMDDFKINTAFLHSSGTLLLDPADGDLAEGAPIEEQTQFHYHGMDRVVSPMAGDVAPGMDACSLESSVCGEPEPMESYADAEVPRDAAPMQEGVTTLENPQTQEGARGSVSLLRAGHRRAPSQRSAVIDLDAIIQKRTSKSAGGRTTNAGGQMEDVWALEDPYQEGGLTEKASNPKNSFKIPKGKKDKTKDKKEEMWQCDFVTNYFFSHRRKFPKKQLLAPQWSAFDDRFWEGLKKKKDTKKAWPTWNPEDDQETEDDDVQENDAPEDLGQQPMNDQQKPMSYDFGPELDDGDFDVPPPPVISGARRSRIFEKPENDGGDLGDEGGHPEIVEGGAPRREEKPPPGLTYEEEVQWYLDRYHEEAQNFAVTTELTKRVDEWEQKITPTLLLEEARRSFDIHNYGSEILENFSEIGEQQSFKRLMREKPRWEVCRYFLSSLMLSNTYNVEIVERKDATPVEKMDNMSLKLLSKDRHHEQFA